MPLQKGMQKNPALGGGQPAGRRTVAKMTRNIPVRPAAPAPRPAANLHQVARKNRKT